MTQSDRSDVFISYRRVNKEFVQRLDQSLKDEGLEVWIDWEDIPPGSIDFNDDIQRGIEGADSFIAVLSPDYLMSPYTMGELEYAARLHKKLIPIVFQKFDDNPQIEIPTTISHINWIYFTPHIGEQNDFEDAFPRIIQALQTDLDHVRHHTRLLIRAREWEKNDRDPGFVLTGTEIAEAEAWLAEGSGKEPRLTQLHSEFIFASRAVARSRQRRLLLGVSIALVVSLALTVLSVLLFRSAEQARKEAVHQEELAKVERDRANRNADEAKSLALAAAADQIDRVDPILALALASQAVGIQDPPGGAQRQFAEIVYSPGAIRQFERHTGAVRSVVFSPLRGDVGAVSASDDGTVILWNTETGEPLKVIEFGGGAQVNSVAFSPDGTRLLAGGSNGEMTLWDRESGTVIQRFTGAHSVGVSSVAFSPDGLYVLSGSDDETAVLWDIETGEPLTVFAGHTSWINDLAFSPQGDTFATASNDRTVILWNVEAGEMIHQFQEHRSWATSVAFSPDGATLIVGLGDNTLVQWDVRSTMERLRVFNGHNESVTSVAYNPLRKMIISSDQVGNVILWDVRTGDQVVSFIGHSNDVLTLDDRAVNDVAFNFDGTRAMTAGSDGLLVLWDVVDNGNIEEPTLRFASHTNWVLGLDINDDGQLATASADETILLWDAQTASPQMLLEGHDGWINEVRYFANGTRLISASDDETLMIWDVDETSDDFGLSIMTLEGHTDWVRTIDVSPDEFLVASGSADRTIRLWDINPESDTYGETIREFEGHSNILTSVEFNFDGTRLLSSSFDGTVRLWDVATGEQLLEITGHEGVVRDASFSPDGLYAATAADDRTVKVWDLTTGEQLFQYIGHGESVRTVAFSPDGTMLLTGSVDQLVILWTVQTQEILRTFRGHTDSVLAVAFTPDGQHAISSSADNQLLMWRVDTLDELFEIVNNSRIVRPLDCREREFYDVQPRCDENGNLPVIENETKEQPAEEQS